MKTNDSQEVSLEPFRVKYRLALGDAVREVVRGRTVEEALASLGLPDEDGSKFQQLLEQELNALASGLASMKRRTGLMPPSRLPSSKTSVAHGGFTAIRRCSPALGADVPWRMPGHRLHDLRSLALHEAAVRVLEANPERAERALEVLARWELTTPAHTLPLLREWRHIIENRLWHIAVEDNDKGQQLRQASPLPFVLDEDERDDIRRRFHRE
jgi:hypothetical protein